MADGLGLRPVEGPGLSPVEGRFASGRHAGALIPLFSIPSSSSWGVGEIPDLPRFARWLEMGGLRFVQLLPVNEMAEGQNSPYSALTAMAIDPIFISVNDLPEFHESGGEPALPPGERACLDEVRRAAPVDYPRVRALKSRVFREAFDMFISREWRAGSARAASFRGFIERERWWVDDYALYRALHDDNAKRSWLDWEPDLSRRTPAALDDARRRLESHILYYMWLQWVADEQWQAARRACGRVGIFGDFPFVVGADSADVWARQHEFRVEASVGVPPDAFSETGQDWGLPAYRWDVVAAGGDEWLRQRASRCAELFDGFRIDHLVGFYRTYMREPDGTAHFEPPDEPSQLALGERLMALFAETGSRLIAEDLGTVPDFVRESLARLRLPGMKVLRWERHWNSEGQPFRDPALYPADSVATSGTHDTETHAGWWEAADIDERRRACEIPALRDAGCRPDEPFSAKLRDALLAALYASGSDLLILPVQDIFGWRDRVNTPALVSDENWSWRLPFPVDRMPSLPEAQERAGFLKQLTLIHGRGNP
jgi:4-alpha-glucanotransferase